MQTENGETPEQETTSGLAGQDMSPLGQIMNQLYLNWFIRYTVEIDYSDDTMVLCSLYDIDRFVCDVTYYDNTKEIKIGRGKTGGCTVQLSDPDASHKAYEIAKNYADRHGHRRTQ